MASCIIFVSMYRFLLFGVFLFIPWDEIVAQQDKSMFKEKRERRRVWRKWRSDKGAYNPYLKKKGKDKPSGQMASSNKKEIRKQRRTEKKQLRRNKRTINKHNKVR